MPGAGTRNARAVEIAGWPMMQLKAMFCEGQGWLKRTIHRVGRGARYYEKRRQERCAGMQKAGIVPIATRTTRDGNEVATNSIVSSMAAVHFHFSIASVPGFASKG